MADISKELKAWKEAVYGEEVRQAQVDLSNKLNTEVEAGTAIAKKCEAAEVERVNSEKNRVTTENTRAQNESARITAETGRVNIEKNRVSAEQNRVTVEQNRVTAESDRVNAEKGRVIAETARTSAETGRVNVEKSRVSEFTTLKTASETATAKANKAADDANGAKTNTELATDAANKVITKGEGLISRMEATDLGGVQVGGRNLAQGTLNGYGEEFTKFNGIENECLPPLPVYIKVLTDGLRVGDIVTVRMMYKYKSVVPVAGKIATCCVQAKGNVTEWNIGRIPASSTLTLNGSGEHEFCFNFKINADHLKNSHWLLDIRHNWIQSGAVAFKELKVERGTIATDWTPAPEDKLDTIGGIVTGPLQLQQGYTVHKALGTQGAGDYVKIAQIKILEVYANTSFVISLVQRGWIESTLEIRFANANSLDPTIEHFRYRSGGVGAHLHKSAPSTWDLYIRKSESYDSISVTNVKIPENLHGKINLTWTDIHASTLPSGTVQASAALDASQLPENVTPADAYVVAVEGSSVRSKITLANLFNFIKEKLGSAATHNVVNNATTTVAGFVPDARVVTDLGNKISDTGWINIMGTSMASSQLVAPTAGNVIRYRKKNGIVYLQGTVGVKNLDTSSYSLEICTMPVGYRSAGMFYVSNVSTGNTLARWIIRSTGIIALEWIHKLVDGTNVTGAISWVSIDVSYPAD